MSIDTVPEADPRIPFPHADTALACRAHPGRFVYEHGDTSADTTGRIDQARAACRSCPIVNGCLKWALANPELTVTGIWAATTPRQRTTLRRRLQDRLGPDWVGVVAQQERARAQRRQEQRLNPLSVADRAMADLAPAPHPMWGSHYEPWREPLTPERQQRNRDVLLLGLTGRTA
ncbi:WhiB family transcriptional regulator [Streptomyces sp. SAJ15]|uniref:WhiB family transcriptional regulator n=1 Tax=Streptomyces sp. SAJ15 TaxID=2011095 RepID=UPI00118729A1|nr:WhiB family transcriptional regulator [Streptomyces sp. SAJ15]TVL88461.1 WhiB family transcriptional regulator [Streptomyces sp. SAJ15]